MKTFSVYIITCNIDNRKYVGMTSQEVRKRMSNGKKYKGSLGKAVSDYGWDSFSYEIVRDGLSLNDAALLEERLIKELDTTNKEHGFNQTRGGECRFIGHSQSSDTRERISEKLKKRGFSEEHRMRISNSKAGLNHHFAKPVYQYEKDGTFVKKWSYMSEAAKAIGINKTCISAACRGKTKTSGGYVWSYTPIGE